jgi:hypothetical protein
MRRAPLIRPSGTFSPRCGEKECMVFAPCCGECNASCLCDCGERNAAPFSMERKECCCEERPSSALRAPSPRDAGRRNAWCLLCVAANATHLAFAIVGKGMPRRFRLGEMNAAAKSIPHPAFGHLLPALRGEGMHALHDAERNAWCFLRADVNGNSEVACSALSRACLSISFSPHRGEKVAEGRMRGALTGRSHRTGSTAILLFL